MIAEGLIMKILTQPVTVQHKINCDKKFENNKTSNNKKIIKQATT